MCLVLALCACGCFRATFVEPRAAPPGRVETTWEHHFLWGLAGSADVDLRDVCGELPVREVQTRGDVLTGGVTVISLGLYAPRRVRVVCAATEGEKTTAGVRAPHDGDQAP